MMQNGLTLQISMWYKQLRFKDIVQGFGKLKKWLKKKWNGMSWIVGLGKLKKIKKME